MAIQKSIVDVELMYGPVARGGQLKNHTNRGGFDDLRESLREVNTGTLCKSTDNPASLIPVERTVREEFLKYARKPLREELP